MPTGQMATSGTRTIRHETSTSTTSTTATGITTPKSSIAKTDGTENITVEYCTDAGGSRNAEPFSIQSIHVRGHNCTFRWNRLAGGAGNGIEVYKPGTDDLYPEFGFTEDVVDRISTDNDIYGNEISEFGKLAIAFDDETRTAQRHVCGNTIRGDTNGDPEKNCPESLPEGDGIGHTGGDSPWA